MALEPIEVIGAIVAVLSVAAVGYAALHPHPRPIPSADANVQTVYLLSGKILAEPLPFPDDPCRSAQVLNESWLAARRGSTPHEDR